MKILKIILLIVGVLIAGFFIWNAVSEKSYEVSRSIEIDADIEVVFGVVGDYKTWPLWTAWYEKDSTVIPSFGEITAGLGATYKWTSKNSGNGSMEFIVYEPMNNLASLITFEGMGQSMAYWTFQSTEDGKTVATWTMVGELPFLFRFMGSSLEKNIGLDFERGLEKLKQLIESQEPVFAIEEKILQPTDMFYISHELFFIEMTDEWYQEAYKKIYNYLGADTAYITGNPTSIYHDWDEETERTIVDLAIPCASPKTGNNEVKKGTTPTGRTIYTTSYGNYDGLKDAHDALDAHMIKRGLEWNGPAMEVYMLGPKQTPDFDQWQTEIYYSVK